MKLSVPFIPDKAYADFLAGHDSFLESIYFPLSFCPPFDARVRTPDSGIRPNDLPNLISSLAPLTGVKKYILVNTRFVVPDLYANIQELNRFLDSVADIHQAVGIQGLVFSDFYLINAMDKTNHEMIPALEAIPGINTMMDSKDQFTAFLDLLGQTRFALPGRLILDRSLNRSPKKLKALYQDIKSVFPDISIELLANEGCIFHCPFKPAHDAHIALSNTGLVKESTWRINQSLGCHHYFASHPHLFFKSPFIRPEDQIHYQGMADTIKLGGRTLGTKFLQQCIKAYASGTFQGNLLDLMDATRFLGQKFHIDNGALGPDFFATLTTCTKDCKPCRICSTLFKKTACEKSVTLTAYKDI